MKKFSHIGVILVMTVLLSLAACNQPNQPSGAAPAMPNTLLLGEATETATAPIEADTFVPPPTDPGCTSTNIIEVPLSSGRCIRVTTNAPQLKNTTAQALSCKVVGPTQTTPISVNANSTKGFDTTASGAYTLSCIGKNLSVKIEK